MTVKIFCLDFAVLAFFSVVASSQILPHSYTYNEIECKGTAKK